MVHTYLFAVINDVILTLNPKIFLTSYIVLINDLIIILNSLFLLFNLNLIESNELYYSC